MNPLAPWHWRSLPLEGRTGSEIFAALFYQQTEVRSQPKSASTPLSVSNSPSDRSSDPINAIAVLLESPYPLPRESSLREIANARYSICAGSPRVVAGQPQYWTPQCGEILPLLRGLLQRDCPEAMPPAASRLPFTGGWLGWLSYDVAWEVEKLPQLNADPLPFPPAFWYEPAAFAVLDHQAQVLWLAASTVIALDRFERKLEQHSPTSDSRFLETVAPSSGLELQKEDAIAAQLADMTTESVRFEWTQSDYEFAVNQAKRYIRAGDIFQANLSLRFSVATQASSWQLYRQLQRINPSPFACYWQVPWGAIVSCSPERLIAACQQQVQTRPIAGTRSRGRTPIEDRQNLQDLLASTKDRAEHIMLVDLERNDLGRVCQWGSVQVDELLVVERYSHVMHLVSNVMGTLRNDCDPVDLIRAVFPGGTITGCPKVRCMEIIEELEPVKRSLFYGSCGYLDCRGTLDLNLLIRTLLVTPDPPNDPSMRVWGQVGAGIVADSNPTLEWYESLNKAQAQLIALQQTMNFS